LATADPVGAGREVVFDCRTARHQQV